MLRPKLLLIAVAVFLVQLIQSSGAERTIPGVKEVQVPFSSLKPSATFKIGKTADWVLVTDDGVWVGGSKRNSVQRIDPSTKRIIAKISLSGEACSGLAFGFGSVWVPVCGKSPTLWPGFLVEFFEAHNALKWTGRPIEERRKVIIDRIVDLFGPEGAHPIDYEDQDWPAEVWSRGCFGASVGPGIMTTVGKVIRQLMDESIGQEQKRQRNGWATLTARFIQRPGGGEILSNYQRPKASA